MTLRPFLSASLLLVLAAATPSVARAPAAAVVPASTEPVQFYVFSFTDTPAAEAAQDLVGGALAYALTIDPAVEGVVSFRTEGWSSGDALLKEFGAALLDEDIALMRTGPGAYALIPRVNVPMLLARGGVLMTLAEPASARPPSPAAIAVPAVAYGQDRWWEGALTALVIFFAGALAGGAALFGGQTVYRRAEAQGRLSPPVLRLTDQRLRFHRPSEPADADAHPDLIIPRFDTEPRG